MRHLFHLAQWSICLSLLILPQFKGVVAQAVFAADAEPNDQFNQAIPITLDSAFEGQLNVIPGDAVDLYTFVLPDDGVLLLQVECEQAGSVPVELELRGYALQDSVNVMVPPGIATPGTNGVPVLSDTQVSCMKEGIHYLRVSQVQSGGGNVPLSYRITASHRPMAFADDAEPNNDMATAIPLQQGVWAEGRLSVEWPNNDPADDFDYYRIHKTISGPLILQTEIAAEFDNTPNEPFEFFVHNADNSLSSGAEGLVQLGSMGVPAQDIAVYPTLSDTGVYFVRLFNPLAYGYSYRFSWSAGTVGIPDPHAATTLIIAPQPASAMVTMIGPAMDLVRVMDTGGRTVATIKPAGSDRLDLNTTTLVPGTYLVRATLRDGRTVVKRFVVGR